MLYIDIKIVGATPLGISVLKEVSRFVHSFQSKIVNIEHVCLYGDDIIEEEDDFFVKEEVGAFKTAVAIDIMRDVFEEASYFSKFVGYILPAKEFGKRHIGGDGWRKKMTIVIDCTSGRAKKLAGTYGMNTLLVVPSKESIQVFLSSVPSYPRCFKMQTESIPIYTSRILSVITEACRGSLDIGEHKVEKFPGMKKETGAFYVIVGTGGTGGDLVKMLLPKLLKEDSYLLLIDGDKVEQKNISRQAFSKADIGIGKADILRDNLCSSHPSLEGRIFSHPYYLDEVMDLKKAIYNTKVHGKELVLFGCVDNHRARQVLEGYVEDVADIIYIDSGNEFDYGEVVISKKVNGNVVAPVRSFYFPEVKTDNGLRASEVSCGVINEVSPQHIVTNLLAAAYCLKGCHYARMHKGGGVIHFKSFNFFERFIKAPIRKY